MAANSSFSQKACPECGGRGYIDASQGYENYQCASCAGRGWIVQQRDSGFKEGEKVK